MRWTEELGMKNEKKKWEKSRCLNVWASLCALFLADWIFRFYIFSLWETCALANFPFLLFVDFISLFFSHQTHSNWRKIKTHIAETHRKWSGTGNNRRIKISNDCQSNCKQLTSKMKRMKQQYTIAFFCRRISIVIRLVSRSFFHAQ